MMLIQRLNKNECEFIPRSRECNYRPSITKQLTKHYQAIDQNFIHSFHFVHSFVRSIVPFCPFKYSRPSIWPSIIPLFDQVLDHALKRPSIFKLIWKYFVCSKSISLNCQEFQVISKKFCNNLCTQSISKKIWKCFVWTQSLVETSNINTK